MTETHKEITTEHLLTDTDRHREFMYLSEYASGL